MTQQKKSASAVWILLGSMVLGAGLALWPASPVTPPAPVAVAPAIQPQSLDQPQPVSLLVPAQQQLSPAVPPVSQPVPPREENDGSIALPPEPVFQGTDGQFQIDTPRYSATVTDQGLLYQPHVENLRDDGMPAPALSVRTQRASRGEQVLYDRARDAAQEPGVADDGNRLSFWRAPGFEERMRARADGVEQSFVLDRRPAGEGDLEIVCELEALSLLPMHGSPGIGGGISFSTLDGQVAVRYGQVTVRDAGRGGVAAQPRLLEGGRAIAFNIPGKWLDEAAYPVVIDPLVGTDFQISPDNDFGVGPPVVIAGANSYLVVWNDFVAGGQSPQLFASIVSRSGVVAPAFPISIVISRPLNFRLQRISGAFDGSNWLVVWSDDRPGGGGIYGSIVGATGAVLGGTDFLIDITTGLLTEDPLCVFNGFDFIVAWQNTPPGLNGGSQIHYSRVTSGGTVTDPVVLPTSFSPINQALYTLSPQTPSGDTLLIYQELSESPAQIRSVRIAPQANTGVKDPGGTALWSPEPRDGGFGRPIGATFVESEGTWHILSSDVQTRDGSIFLHKFTPDGVVTPPSGVFATFGLGPTGLVGIDDYSPAFAGSGEWLFVRNQKVTNTVFHLIGKRVTFDGVDRDPTPFQIDTATQGLLFNAVVAFTQNQFLVTWSDGRRSSAQPASSRNIFGAFVDATVAGDAAQALLPVIAASPTSGEAPLDVSFSATDSLGSYDTITWTFGDGTTSTQVNVAKTYRANGTYAAQLKLTKGAYSVTETVYIKVGTGDSGSGIPEVGTPVENTTNLVPGLYISSVSAKLNFVDSPSKKDSLVIRGILDAQALPESLGGTLITVTMGSFSSTFALDAKGVFKSNATVKPITSFAVEPRQGSFVFNFLEGDLRTVLSELGANNETVRPPKFLEAPISISIAGSTTACKVTAAYSATIDLNGQFLYNFKREGEENSGSFYVRSFTAQEGKNDRLGVKIHAYTIRGQLVKPGGGPYRIGNSGQFTFTIGNFSLSIPVQFVVGSSGKVSFKAPRGATGVKLFQIEQSTGNFMLQLTNVPAEGADSSGMPLANSGGNVVKCDLNLSIQLDLLDNETLKAGRFIFIGRGNAAAKGWRLR